MHEQINLKPIEKGLTLLKKPIELLTFIQTDAKYKGKDLKKKGKWNKIKRKSSNKTGSMNKAGINEISL